MARRPYCARNGAQLSSDDRQRHNDIEQALAFVAGPGAMLHSAIVEGSVTVRATERLLHLGPISVAQGVTIAVEVGGIWAVM